MSAVNVKLSRRDAKYLVGLLDAVSAATKGMDKRDELPPRFDRPEVVKAIRSRLLEVTKCWPNEAMRDDLREFLPGLGLASDILTDILPHFRGTSPEVQERERRCQALMNTLPLGDVRSAHVLSLRIGATIQSACNIADEHSTD